jgi:MFS family permease
LAANVGLLVGAIFWSFGCDIWGRRWSFNLTLLITGVFGLAAGGAPDFIALASLIAVVGVGVGGNMPVDSAVFLDLVPGTHQYLLTVMAIWWSFGQLLVSLIAWPLIANFSCKSPENCTRSDNMGWRYLLFCLGGLTLFLWGLRFFVFTLLESPRYLIGKGDDEAAVNIVHQLAKMNGTTTELTVDKLRKVAAPFQVREEEEEQDVSTSGLVQRKKVLSESSYLTVRHVKALFSTPKMAWSTSLLMTLWAVIGLASTLYNNFLPYLLNSRGAQFGDGSLDITYRNNCILAIIGLPAALLSGYAVDTPFLGRKGTLAIASGE